MVGWHHWLSGHEFEQTPGDSGWQGSGAWYDVVREAAKESDMTEWLTLFTFTCWWNLYSISASRPLSAFLNLSHFILKQIFLIYYLYSCSCFHHYCYNSSEKFLGEKKKKIWYKSSILLMYRLLVSLFWANSIVYFWSMCVCITE